MLSVKAADYVAMVDENDSSMAQGDREQNFLPKWGDALKESNL